MTYLGGRVGGLVTQSDVGVGLPRPKKYVICKRSLKIISSKLLTKWDFLNYVKFQIQ